ncbi:MAG: hypothetical protein ACRCT8_00485 [Lacipirellulaceae bacterium]
MSTATPSPTPTHDEWAPCPPGRLAELGTGLRRAERSRRTLRFAGVATTCVAIVAAGYFGLNPAAPASCIIACHTAVGHFEAYSAHLTGDATMPAAKAQEVTYHLAHCEHCRARFENRYPGLLGKKLGAAALLTLICFVRRRPDRARCA